MVIIDPAAFQRVQTDERTVADIYKNEGFSIRPARTNAVAARISAVDKYLTRVVDGRYGFIACPVNANNLVQALAGKYRYKINTKGVRDEKPEKSHPWSDIADAFQYMCLHADGGEVFGAASFNVPERKSLRCQRQGGHNLLTRYRFDDICSEDCDICFSILKGSEIGRSYNIKRVHGTFLKLILQELAVRTQLIADPELKDIKEEE